MALIMPTGKPSRTQEQAVQGVRGYAQHKGYGQLSDQDIAGLGQQVGYGGSGDVSDDQYQGAIKGLDAKFGQVAPQAAPTPTQGPPPAAAAPTPLPANYGAQFAPERAGLVASILRNPNTMGAQFQDQLFEGQKEQALAYRKQLGDQAAQNSVNRGQSQVNASILSGLDNNLTQQLLQGRRDIATNAAVQNRADQLNALGAAGQFDQSQLGVQQLNNQNLMDLWKMGEGVRQFDTNYGLGNRQTSLQEFLGTQGNELERMKFDELRNQFKSTFGLDLLQFMEGQRQFGANFGENQRQFNNTMGLNWFNSGQNQNNNFLNWLINAGII